MIKNAWTWAISLLVVSITFLVSSAIANHYTPKENIEILALPIALGIILIFAALVVMPDLEE